MLVIRREVRLAVGGFSEIDYAEESALMNRLRARGVNQWRLDKRSCVYHCSHADTITHNRAVAG